MSMETYDYCLQRATLKPLGEVAENVLDPKFAKEHAEDLLVMHSHQMLLYQRI